MNTTQLVIKRAEEVIGQFRLAEKRKDSFDIALRISLENLAHALTARIVE